MIEMIYRWLYRRERLERQQRMSAMVEVWQQRRRENDARHEAEWRQMKADFEQAKQQLPPDEFLAWVEAYRRPSTVRMEDT